MLNIFEQLPNDIVKTNETMKAHTSFKVGGIADYFIVPQNLEQLKLAINTCTHNNIDYYIIGNGSNILVSDNGYRGAIIQIFKNMNSFCVKDNTIEAYSGILLSKLSNIALENNLTGFEFATGIPGTLGGAVTMNAGAYGGEIKQVIASSLVMDNRGNMFTLTRDELELGYRTSKVSKENLIVISAKLCFEVGEYETIKEYIYKLNVQRKEKQPLEFPSAGSTFKRPEGYFAGKLIMDSGLKGFCIGDAQISEKHCGFIVNKGNATSQNIFDLIKYVQKIVDEKFGVKLEPEIKFIGQF